MIIFLFILFDIIHSQINIATHGEIWYCNSHPLDNIEISPLSSNDLDRIKQLQQVHVMIRHGTRTSHINIQQYFPNSTEYYQCDISTITSRINRKNNEYFIPMLEIYENGNQLLLNSNCEMEQSWPNLIDQQHENAQILINAYMSSNDKSQLFDISLTNKQSITKDYIKIYTSNAERCMLSTMAMISYLLNISATNSTKLQPIIETITNDPKFNPYSPWNNAICTQQEQYKLWQNKSTNDMFSNYINPKREIIMNDEKYINTMKSYQEQGGVIINESFAFHEHPGFRIANFYCNGLNLPLDDKTFWDLIQIGKNYTSTIPNRFSNDQFERKYLEKQRCIYHFYAIPMYKRVYDDIYKMLTNEMENDKFILHSAHDSSIIAFLSGLNLYDGIVPYFAQFWTLEIYSSNDEEDGEYLFRFTHRGEFIEYEHCKQEYEDKQSELCNLDILLNNGFKNVNITQREWAEKSCANLMDDCECGYCEYDNQDNNDMNNGKWILEGYSFLIGICCGLTIFGLIHLVLWYIKLWKKQEASYGYQQQIANHDDDGNDSSDVEMIGGNEILDTK